MKDNLIITSVGPPPERYANRIVAEMVRQIALTRTQKWDDIWETLLAMSDGNPKAQLKTLRRLRKAGGKFFFAIDCTTGKRGRYSFSIIDLHGYDPMIDKTIDDLNTFVPEKPWLVCTATKLTSKGNYKYESKTVSLLMFTHHAMSRLVQRCGARTVDDLIAAMQSMFDSFLVAWHDKITIHNGYRLPFEVTDKSIAEAVLRDRDGVSLVTTILLPDE